MHLIDCCGQDYELFLVWDEAKVSSTATHRTRNELNQSISADGSIGAGILYLALQ